MMRIAVLSDIHGNLPALEAVVADAERRSCDRFVNLGDIVSGPLWPRETADFLMAHEWPTIAGNQERQLLTLSRDEMGLSDRFAAGQLTDSQREWLASLPPVMDYDSDIFLCHGTPDSDLVYFLDDVDESGAFEADEDRVLARLGAIRARLTLCGHTHIPRVIALADGRYVANPGSVGLPAYEDIKPFPHRMETGSPHARYAIVDNLEVELLAVEYDYERSAAKADREDRPDWSIALRTGHV